MLSHELGCLYIHINRNGGKSIEKALWGVEAAHGSSDHRTLAYWQKTLNPELYAWLFKFAFVRNPWDRLVSLYERYRADQEKDKKYYNDRGFWKAVNSPFPDFARAIDTKRHPVRTQVSFIADLSGEVGLDFVGRFESYQKDWEKVCQTIGVHIELPHLNQSSRRDYRSYYTQEAVDIVAEKYRVDVELFGYQHGG